MAEAKNAACELIGPGMPGDVLDNPRPDLLERVVERVPAVLLGLVQRVRTRRARWS
jgi:hypothetical protein